MSTAVIFLKERRYRDNYFLVVGELTKYILQPYEETENQEFRQKYGDQLSNGNALYFPATFLSRIDMRLGAALAWDLRCSQYITVLFSC